MGIFHADVTPTNGGQHQPYGHSQIAVMTLIGATAVAYRIEDENNLPAFQVDTSADFIDIGNPAAAGTWAAIRLTASSAQVNLADDFANAFVVEEEADGTAEYIAVSTTNSDPAILFSNTTNNAYTEHRGTGDFRLGSQIRITERTGDPTNVANTGFLYTKDVSTVTELFYEDSAGTVTQLSGAGGGGTPHTITGDDQVILQDSVNSRAGLTMDAVIDGTERIEVGNDTDDYQLRIIQLATSIRALEFGTEAGADQAIVIGMNQTYPANFGDNNISIGNSMDLNDSGNITVVGDATRIDGIQIAHLGGDGRAQDNDSIVGYDSESTNVTGLNAGIGQGLRFSGNNNSALGRSILDNGGNNNVYLGAGCRGSASATSTMFVGGQTAAQAVRTYIFGRGGDIDDTDDTVLLFRASHKSGTDLDGIFRFNSGDATGAGKTSFEWYVAEPGGAGSAARVAVRAMHLEKSSDGNELHIGDEAAVADDDANILFNAGTGAATRQGRIWYDGSADAFEGTINGGTAAFGIRLGQVFVGQSSSTNSNSAVFGHSSDCFGTNGILVGNDSTITSGCSNSILVGYLSSLSATADNSVLVGSSAGSGNDGASAIGFGYDVQIGHDECLVVSREGASTASNQAVFGSQNYNYTVFALGQGVEGNFSPADITVRATHAITGSNLIGAELAIASGGGTGNGDSGGLKLQVPSDNPSSTTQQAIRTWLFLNPNIGEQSSQSWVSGRFEENCTTDGDANATKYSGEHELAGTGAQSWSIPYLIPDDSAGWMHIYATAYDTTANEVAMYAKAVRFRRAGATLNVAVVDLHADSEEGTASSWSFTAVGGGGGDDIQINATGDATNSTQWAFYWQLQNVS